MSQLSLVIRLRPTRIALLTRPGDTTSIRKFMRSCASLWGGVYNPIIPVFRTAPSEWKPRHPESIKGYAIARGYAAFFEPDVYVEAETGLLDECGLGSVRSKHGFHDRVLSLKELFRQEDHRDWSEPAVGLSVTDVLRHVYETEQRFTLRNQRPSVAMTPSRSSPFVEAMFGAYPSDKPARYIAKGFEDVYRPERAPATPATWLKIVNSPTAITPLRLTRFGLETNRTWMHDLVVFVFDPEKTVDLIDLWNMRLEAKPILPVPLPWFPELAEEIRKRLIAEHRPLQGNPNGVMHHGTVEFARSISEERAKGTLQLLRDMPKGAMMVKFWRTRIWERHTNDFVHRDRRLEVTAKDRRATAEIAEGERPTAKFDALAPDFATRYSGAQSMRWVNAVRVSHYGREDIATIVPFNTRDWSWPRLHFTGDPVQVGSEGWIYGQQYKDNSETIELHRQEDVIVGMLGRRGVEAKMSEPGHIAKQVLAHLGGMWGVPILADKTTLMTLNAMAGGFRRRGAEGEQSEELFDRRSKPFNDWRRLLEQRNQAARLGSRFSLDDFTSHNILRLGIETACPHCKAANWHSLTIADYELTCERCLKKYRFPQAQLMKGNGNWRYRTIGPFSVHDYARGAYGALLALHVLHRFGGSHSAATFSTALTMEFDGLRAEADYVALHARERFDTDEPAQLVIGEAKSLGEGELIKQKDLAKLKAIGDKLPGCAIAISVMRDDFTDVEKRLLKKFINWARKPDDDGQPSHPVLLFTGNELFFDFSISSTWKDIGGRHAMFADHNHTRTLAAFAEATQAIYLDLPSFQEERRVTREKRRARKQAKQRPI